jgi:hypothetical protein
MMSSRLQDRERLDVFIHGANIAHFLSLFRHETDAAKRATILMLLAQEPGKENASWDLTTSRASGASPLPGRQPESVPMTARAGGHR